MRPALLVHNQLPLSIWQCIFIHHILKEKANKVYQVLDGCLIEVTTIGELSLGRQKRWLQPLNKGGGYRGLICHSLLQLLGDFDNWPLNPLSPKSDQHQISPCNINAL